MVRQHIALTLLPAVVLAFIVWEHSPVWTPLRIAGLCLLSTGFVLWTVSRFQLGSSFRVTAQANQLVSRGLYSKIRNPIYVFGSCVIAGLILILGRPVWLLVFAAIIPLQIWRARKEAAVLEAKFGEQYRAYRSSTWF